MKFLKCCIPTCNGSYLFLIEEEIKIRRCNPDVKRDTWRKKYVDTRFNYYFECPSCGERYTSQSVDYFATENDFHRAVGDALRGYDRIRR